MTEPDVTLTDYALAMEGILFLILLQRGRARSWGMRSWFSLFFASVSAASLCGGTVHGFFLDEQTLGHTILWPTTLLPGRSEPSSSYFCSSWAAGGLSAQKGVGQERSTRKSNQTFLRQEPTSC